MTVTFKPGLLAAGLLSCASLAGIAGPADANGPVGTNGSARAEPIQLAQREEDPRRQQQQQQQQQNQGRGEQRQEQRQERRDDRQERREDRKDVRQERREERRDVRQDPRQQQPDPRQQTRPDSRMQQVRPQDQRPDGRPVDPGQIRRDAREERRDDRKDVRQDLRDVRKDAREERRDDRKDVRQDLRDLRKDAREAPPQDRKDIREKMRDVRKDAREERRDDRKDTRDTVRDIRKDAREERRDDRKDVRRDLRDARQDGRDFRRMRLDDIKKERRERVEGGRRIIEEPDRRLIVREQGRAVIRHDEGDRFRRTFRDQRVERRNDGSTVTTYIRPGGIQVISVVDSHGRLLHRYRRGPDGRRVVLIDNRRYHRPGVGGIFLGGYVALAPPVIRIPREKYIVDYEDSSYDDVYEALSAPPIEELDRGYSLDEIRQSQYVRERVRRVDLDSVNFEFGSWEVPPEQYNRLERMARAINRVLERNPDAVFMVEGHTDAVGSDEDNLTLSDRRAESVAMILSDEFGVPPENLVTQGYGEQFLKIDTEAPEIANRRVAVRNISGLMSRSE